MAKPFADGLARAGRGHDRGQRLGHAGHAFVPVMHDAGEILVGGHAGRGGGGLGSVKQAKRQLGRQRLVFLGRGQRGVVGHWLTQSFSRNRLRRSQLRTVLMGRPSRAARSA